MHSLIIVPLCLFTAAASAQNMCAALLQGGTFDTAFTNRDTFAADFARSSSAIPARTSRTPA